MNRRELVAALAERTETDKRTADADLQAFIDTVTDTVAKGETVLISGFAKFAGSTAPRAWAATLRPARRSASRRRASPRHAAEDVQGRGAHRQEPGEEGPGQEGRPAKKAAARKAPAKKAAREEDRCQEGPRQEDRRQEDAAKKTTRRKRSGATAVLPRPIGKTGGCDPRSSLLTGSRRRPRRRRRVSRLTPIGRPNPSRPSPASAARPRPRRGSTPGTVARVRDPLAAERDVRLTDDAALAAALLLVAGPRHRIVPSPAHPISRRQPCAAAPAPCPTPTARHSSAPDERAPRPRAHPKGL